MLIVTTAFKHFTEEKKIPFHSSFQWNFNYGNEGDFGYLPERDEYNSIKKNYKLNDFEHLLKIHPRRKVLFSSRFNLSIFNSRKKFTFLIFIQDPINKIISDYNFLCASKKNFQSDHKRLNFNLYIERLLKSKLWNKDNEHKELFDSQTDFLFYKTNIKNRNNFFKKKIIDGSLLILPIERFFDCALFLKLKQKKYFPRIIDNHFNFNDFTKIKKKLSITQVEDIKNKFKEDYSLYKISEEKLNYELKKNSNIKKIRDLENEIKFFKFFDFYHRFVSKFFNFFIVLILFFFKPFIKKFFIK